MDTVNINILLSLCEIKAWFIGDCVKVSHSLIYHPDTKQSWSLTSTFKTVTKLFTKI